MKSANTGGLFHQNKLLYIRAEEIRPNPNQPRRIFDQNSLYELAESIKLYGILQPLSVRRVAGRYELVSGERRLRAAQMAELTTVPCILVNVDDRRSSLLSLVENLQRQNLDFTEEAQGISQLIREHGLSQEQAAFYLGKSQSAIANKLRILRHPPGILALIRENGLTERHARALLSIEDLTVRQEATEHIVKKQYNVAQTEQYISALLSEQNNSSSSKIKNLYIIKDVRFFLNSIDRAVSIMRKSGVSAKFDRMDTEDAILLTIRIPRHSATRRRGTAS